MFKGKGKTNLASTTWAQFRSVPRGSFLHLDTQQILDHTLGSFGHWGTRTHTGIIKLKAEHTTNGIFFTADTLDHTLRSFGHRGTRKHTGIIKTQGGTHHKLHLF